MNQGVSSSLALDVDGHGCGGSGRGRCAPGSAASWALTGAPRAAEVGTGLILSLLSRHLRAVLLTQRLKEEAEKLQQEFGYCILDGHREKIGNFKTEPPGLFRGRGDHPKMGMLKRRVLPEDVTINCGRCAGPSPGAWSRASGSTGPVAVTLGSGWATGQVPAGAGPARFPVPPAGGFLHHDSLSA